jgi:hypothetical protein
MSTFDYNINNYSIRELKEVIGLPLGEPLTYPAIHAAAAKRLSTAANNPSLFRFFSQIKDRLTRSMVEGDDEGDDEDEDDDEGEDEDDEEEAGGDATSRATHSSILSLQRPTGPIVNAQISDGVPFGNMNPLDRTTVSKVVCIDSVFRDTPDATAAESFLVSLPDNLDRVISLSLTSINLPNTWYNVSDDTALNTFYVKTFNVQSMTTDTMHTVTVPAGNYTAIQMASTLNNIFSNTNGLRLIQVLIDPVTLKTVFRAKMSLDPGQPYYAFDSAAAQTSPDFYYEVYFQSVVVAADLTDCDPSDTAGFASTLDHHNIGYILGFRKTEYVVPKLPGEEDVASFLGNSVIHYCILRSEGVFDTNIIDYVFLELDDFNNNFVTNTVVSRTQRGYIGNNILAQVPVYSSAQAKQGGHVPPGNHVTFKTRNYFGPVKIEKMAVRLLDKRGDLVNLRGNNFSFTVDVVLQYS